MPTYRLLALAQIDLQVTTIPRCLLLASRYVLHHAGSVGLGLVGACCFGACSMLYPIRHPPDMGMCWRIADPRIVMYLVHGVQRPACLPVPRAFLPLGSWHFCTLFLPSIFQWNFQACDHLA